MLQALALGLGPQPAFQMAVVVVAQGLVDLVVLIARHALEVVQFLAAEAHALDEVALLRRARLRRRIRVERADALPGRRGVVAHDGFEAVAPLQRLVAGVDRTLEDRSRVGHEVLDEGVHRLLVVALREPVGDLPFHALGAPLGRLGDFLLGLVAQLLAQFADEPAELFRCHHAAAGLRRLLHDLLRLVDGLADDALLDRHRQVGDRRRRDTPRLLAGGQQDLTDPGRRGAALHLGERRPHHVHAAQHFLHLRLLRGAVDTTAGAEVGQ